MKYQSGDKVRVRKDIKDYCIASGYSREFIADMERRAGTVCTIDEVYDTGIYHIKEDLHGSFWTEHMFDGEKLITPDHYRIAGFEQDTIDVIQAVVEHNATDPWEGSLLKDVLKYMFRYGKKNGLEDLHKARNFLDWLIQHEARKAERAE